MIEEEEEVAVNGAGVAFKPKKAVIEEKSTLELYGDNFCDC